MTIEIEKNNNKELVPLEHYLDAYRKADPEEISARTGFHFDAEKQAFSVSFMEDPIWLLIRSFRQNAWMKNTDTIRWRR